MCDFGYVSGLTYKTRSVMSTSSDCVRVKWNNEGKATGVMPGVVNIQQILAKIITAPEGANRMCKRIKYVGSSSGSSRLSVGR